ncbi:MAG: hypothetical protein ACM3JD_08435 [Rudaea sp.]
MCQSVLPATVLQGNMLIQLRSKLRGIWGLLFYLGPVEPSLAALWRKDDLRRLAGANGLRADAVGPLIGAGLQHHIYRYDGESFPAVLKLMLHSRWLRFPTVEEAMGNLALISRYFGPYAIQPSRVIALADGGLIMEQRRLNRFRSITPDDLTRPALREQFLDVVQRNRAMISETGRSLDLLGREGQRKCRAALFGLGPTPTISNLVFESMPDGTEQLRVLDEDLEDFRKGSVALRDLQSRLAAEIAFESNRFLISRFFGIDIESGAQAIPDEARGGQL